MEGEFNMILPANSGHFVKRLIVPQTLPLLQHPFASGAAAGARAEIAVCAMHRNHYVTPVVLDSSP